jgi:predicted hydrocarbon binding protein
MTIIHDQATGEWRDGPIRYLVMRPDVLMGAFAALPSPQRLAALEALADSARSFGGRSVQAYRDAGANDAQQLLRVMAATSRQLGWGQWSFEYADDRRSLHLTVRNSPFAAGFGASHSPVCHAVRGIFAALAPVVLGQEVAVAEDACAAQDTGEVCRFSMRLT